MTYIYNMLSLSDVQKQYPDQSQLLARWNDTKFPVACRFEAAISIIKMYEYDAAHVLDLIQRVGAGIGGWNITRRAHWDNAQIEIGDWVITNSVIQMRGICASYREPLCGLDMEYALDAARAVGLLHMVQIIYAYPMDLFILDSCGPRVISDKYVPEDSSQLYARFGYYGAFENIPPHVMYAARREHLQLRMHQIVVKLLPTPSQEASVAALERRIRADGRYYNIGCNYINPSVSLSEYILSQKIQCCETVYARVGDYLLYTTYGVTVLGPDAATMTSGNILHICRLRY